MLNSLGLGILLRAKDEASEVVEKIHGGVEGLGKASEKAGHSLLDAFGMSGKALAGVAVGVGAVAVGGMFEFAEHAERFSSAIMRAGVAAHATAEELKEFEEMAKTKSLEAMKGSAIETAETLQQLAVEGFNLKEAGEAVDATLDLMRISMGALGSREAAGLVHDTLAEFGMQASQSGEIVDKFAFAMREFKFRAEELQPAMTGLASGAHLTGSSFDDVLIGVGLLKQVFPSATKAAMGMNTALQQLASTHSQKELAGIGVTVKDTHGKMKPLLEIMQDLSNKTAKFSDAQLAHKLATIGSARAAGGLATIIDALRKGVTDSSGKLLTGAAALEYYRKQLNETQGTAKRMADMLGSDMGGALKALKGAISNAGVAFGSLFEGGFTKAIQMANLFIRGLTQAFTQGGFSGDVKEALDKHTGVKDFVVGLFVWIKRIQHFFSELSDTFTAAFAPFQPVLDLLLTSFGALGAALGITNQSAGDNLATWDSFGGAGANVGNILANLAGAVIPVLVTGMTILIGAIELAKSAWEAIGPVIGGVGEIFAGVFKVIAGLFNGNWKMMWDGFVDIVAGAARVVVNILMGTIGWFAKLIDSVGSAFGKDFGLGKEISELQKGWTGSLVEGTAVLKAVVAPSGAPATAAAIQGQASATAAATAAMGGEELAAALGGGDTTVHVNLNVDGEKLAEVAARAKRSGDARGFNAVPAESPMY